MTFLLYIKFHVLHFFCKSWIIRGSYNTQSRSNTGKSIFWFQTSVTTIWVVIKELCNATSRPPLRLKTSAHFKIGTMRHYFGNSCLLAGIITFRDIFRGHLENGQKSKKLASKTCKIFLARTKISKKQAIELKVKGGPKISFWRRTCPELRKDFVK